MRRLIVLTLSFLSSSALAAGAPPQLHNKSILLSWTTQAVQKGPDGRVITPTLSQQRTIYVSSQGRAFVRAGRGVSNQKFSASKTGESGPDDSRGYDGEARGISFQGNTMIGTQTYASGAGQIRVTFDPSFSSCTMVAVEGKSGGGPIRVRGLDGQMYERISATSSGYSCSIRDGNALSN
ncbi:MAG: hypothetical protein A4S14_06695 [Proteobacteria bacterium SG_bin9]|nr:MAG: hypothetical protein A4S14_06695 [Proteobacteria bacterium SG_bin9]